MALSEVLHPIIQAMQAAQERQRNRVLDAQKVKQDEQKQKNEETDQAFREKQLASTIKMHEDEFSQAEQRIQAEAEMRRVLLQQHKLKEQEDIRDFFEKGGVATKTPKTEGFIPTYTNPEPPADYSVGGIPVSAEQIKQYSELPAANAARQLRQKVEEAKGVTTATQQALEPFKQADDQRAATAQKEHDERLASQKLLDNQFDERMKNNDIASRERITEANNKSQERINANTVEARLKVASNGIGLSDNVLQSYRKGMFITGNDKMIPKDKKTQAAIRDAFPELTLLDSKDASVFDTVGKIQDILNTAQKLADYSLDTAPMSAFAGSKGFGDAGALKNQLKGTAGNIAEIFSKEIGKKTEGDIERAVNLLYSAKLTKAKNQDNIEAARRIFADILIPIAGKYNPDQLEEILSTRGINPKILEKSPDLNDLRKRFKY